MNDILEYFPSLPFYTRQQVLDVANTLYAFEDDTTLNCMLLFDKGGITTKIFHEVEDIFSYVSHEHSEGLLAHMLLPVTIDNTTTIALHTLCYDPQETLLHPVFKHVSVQGLNRAFGHYFPSEVLAWLEKDFTIMQSLETMKVSWTQNKTFQ